MSVLPDTAAERANRRWPGYALAALGLAALLLVGAALTRAGSFAPGEEVYSPGVKDIAASTRDTSYAPSDVLRFEGTPEVVYIYLALEELPEGGELEARIERSGSRSLVSWLLERKGGLVLSDGQKEHLGPSEGVVKFALREESGEPLPAGEYTVGVYASEGQKSPGRPVARKYFVIED